METSPSKTTVELTTTEAAVLGLLARHGESSGYELNRCAERGVGHVWAPAKSRIYAVLPRLAGQGLARSRPVVQQQRPDKQLYRITAAGKRALREWLESIEVVSADVFLLKVFFGDQMSSVALIELIEAHAADIELRLAEYREIERRIADSGRDYHGHLTLRWGIARAEAARAWADEVLRELRRELKGE